MDRTRASIAAVLLLLAGCASHARAVPEPAIAPVARGDHSCPLGVPGTMTIDDTPDGAALTFTTDPGRVDELRRRARDAAAMYGAGAHRGLGHDGEHGAGHRHGLALSELPVRTRVEDVDRGARVNVAIVDPARSEEVREELHARAERVASGECP